MERKEAAHRGDHSRDARRSGRRSSFSLAGSITISFLPVFHVGSDRGPALQAARFFTKTYFDRLRGDPRRDADGLPLAVAPHPRKGPRTR